MINVSRKLKLKMNLQRHSGNRPIDALRTPQVLNYIRQLPVEPMLGEELFPDREVSEMSYRYMVGANNIPVMATVIPFDSPAPVHSREGVQWVEGKIPPIKRKISIDEETMFKLYSPRPGTSEVEDAIAEIYDDVRLMTESVRYRIEYHRLEAITTGKVNIADPESGLRLEADFGLVAAQKPVCDGQGQNSKPWSDPADRTIIADIQRWTREAEQRTGVRPTRALTSQYVLDLMLEDKTIRDMIWNQANSERPITEADLQALLTRMRLPRIAVYEKQARVQLADGKYRTVRFFPENLFVLLPGDKLGDTLYAPTVEALRAVRNNVVNFGEARKIFGEIWETNDPPSHWTMAAALAFPTFPRANEIVIANVDPPQE